MLTADDVRATRFKKAKRGSLYDVAQVDASFAEVIAALEASWQSGNTSQPGTSWSSGTSWSP
ncbi:hypothetical protein GCM10010401_01440 [Rarobacter faecitabidus]|uniref:DivIVA domain-containing protein n=1 Tax=Rarobacter faecitabidus TaxID=13243 RepID=A0A542ZWJ7_RARFA|nr:DivIVA domain-containing protein [Rarobacter faecitabidus]TQL64721.1 DivIVA domain-containing protein [Rarobacter faecitabidus]